MRCLFVFSRRAASGLTPRVGTRPTDSCRPGPLTRPAGLMASWMVFLACSIGWTAGTHATLVATRAGLPTVGMEGRREVTLPGALLEARPVDEKSLIILRVANTFPHGTLTRYDLRYIGVEPGKYDLRDYLRRQDGSPLGDLPPLPVEIAGLLPVPHTGELIERPPGVVGLFGGYRNVLIAAGVIWAVGLLAFWVIGRRRRERTVATASEQPPTLAERLRPLVEQAATGQLSVEGKAQLERLLLTHWRERLELGDLGQAEAIARLRQHPEAGALLAALENWLHRPPGVARVDLNALLAPYRKPAERSDPATPGARQVSGEAKPETKANRE